MRLFEIESLQLTGEQHISLFITYEYTTKFMKRRWLEAEPFIAQDPFYAYMYAKYVIKDKWPEAESVILNSKWRVDYWLFLKSKGIKYEIT